MKNALISFQNRQVARELANSVIKRISENEKDVVVFKAKIALYNLYKKNPNLARMVELELDKKIENNDIKIPNANEIENLEPTDIKNIEENLQKVRQYIEEENKGIKELAHKIQQIKNQDLGVKSNELAKGIKKLAVIPENVAEFLLVQELIRLNLDIMGGGNDGKKSMYTKKQSKEFEE